MIAADYTVLGSFRGGGVLADHGGGAPVEHLQQLLVQEAALHSMKIGWVTVDLVRWPTLMNSSSSRLPSPFLSRVSNIFSARSLPSSSVNP